MTDGFSHHLTKKITFLVVVVVVVLSQIELLERRQSVITV